MAINTEAKRRNAIMVRRLPWFRRFVPLPDGTVSRNDRQQMGFSFRMLPPNPSACIDLPARSLTLDLSKRSIHMDLPARSLTLDMPRK